MSDSEGAPEATGAVGERSGAGGPTRRRTVLEWLIGGFLSLWGLAAALVGVSFLKAPGAEERHREWRVKCGPFSSLPVGGGRLVRHGAGPLIVVRASETQVQAFSAICTHVRCILQWDEKSQTVLCPCHAGVFDRRGNVLSGPPTAPLRQYPAEVRADEIVVHLLG